MKYTAILSSVAFESELLLKQLKNSRRISVAGKEVYKGKLFKHDLLLMQTGIGKVNAAISATALLENFPVGIIIHSGIAGAYPNSGLNIGDVAIAEKEIYGDEGVMTSKGIEGLEKIGIPLLQAGRRRYFNEFPLDKRLFKKTMASAPRAAQIRSGSFVTVSATTGTRNRALELEERYKAICENMEGAAVAHVCTLYGIPMVEIRGISNIAGIRDKRRWKIKLAAENCQKAVLEVMRSI